MRCSMSYRRERRCAVFIALPCLGALLLALQARAARPMEDTDLDRRVQLHVGQDPAVDQSKSEAMQLKHPSNEPDPDDAVDEHSYERLQKLAEERDDARKEDAVQTSNVNGQDTPEDEGGHTMHEGDNAVSAAKVGQDANNVDAHGEDGTDVDVSSTTQLEATATTTVLGGEAKKLHQGEGPIEDLEMLVEKPEQELKEVARESPRPLQWFVSFAFMAAGLGVVYYLHSMKKHPTCGIGSFLCCLCCPGGCFACCFPIDESTSEDHQPTEELDYNADYFEEVAPQQEAPQYYSRPSVKDGQQQYVQQPNEAQLYEEQQPDHQMDVQEVSQDSPRHSIAEGQRSDAQRPSVQERQERRASGPQQARRPSDLQQDNQQRQSVEASSGVPAAPAAAVPSGSVPA